MISQGRDTLLRLIRLVISMGYFAGGSVWNMIRRAAGGVSAGTCVVLYYHSVSTEHRVRFARQMNALVRWTTPIKLSPCPPMMNGGRYAAVTQDDAYEDFIENALPELRKRNIPATVFVSTELLGKRPPWSSGLEDNERERIMSAEQLRELPPELITIGSHTLTHPRLPDLTAEQAKIEISESRRKLERMLNREIKLFSFPFGAFNERLTEWCREAGYEQVFTSQPLLAFSDPHEFVTGRVWAEPYDWLLEFRLKLYGAYRWLPWAFALKRKVLANSMVARIRSLGARA